MLLFLPPSSSSLPFSSLLLLQHLFLYLSSSPTSLFPSFLFFFPPLFLDHSSVIPPLPFYLQVSYAIGIAKPLSIYVDTYGTSKLTTSELLDVIEKNFDLRPGVIIR